MEADKCKDGGEHDWKVRKTIVEGDNRIRQYRCEKCKVCFLRTIPLIYAPRQKTRKKDNESRNTQAEVQD